MKKITALLCLLSFSAMAQNNTVLETVTSCEIKATFRELGSISVGVLEIQEEYGSSVQILSKREIDGREIYSSVEDQVPSFEIRMTKPEESSLPQLNVFYSGRYFQCFMANVGDGEESFRNVGSVGH